MTDDVAMSDHYALMCLLCKDGYGGDTLSGAQAWIEKHNHPQESCPTCGKNWTISPPVTPMPCMDRWHWDNYDGG